MPFGTDDPNVQDLLARNASMDVPAPNPLQFASQTPPQLQGRILPVPQLAAQQAQKPGGVKGILAGMLGGMADAAMKYSTGMTMGEQQQMQATNEHIRQQTEQLAIQNQMAPQMKQAQINALTAQPRFDPSTHQFIGVMNDAQFQQYVRGLGAAQVGAESRENIANTKLDPKVMLGQKYIQQLQSNDQSGAQATLEQLKALGTATSAAKPPAPSMARWVDVVNDPARSQQEKEIAAKNIKLLEGLQEQQQWARGKSYAYNRGLYQWQTVYDNETGMVRPAQGFEIMQAQKEGRPLTASGRLSAKDQLAVQQLNSEAAPAIKLVRDNLDAYDNPNDRAIFARVVHAAGTPRYGQEAGWMGNVLNQALNSGLSPTGQALARNLSRINETVGRFRTIMGAPSTDTQMSLAMALLPGPSTPSKEYAQEQLKNFEDMVNLGVSVPILRGAGGNQTKPQAITIPPKGAKIIDWRDAIK